VKQINTKYTNINRNESTHSEMGLARQRERGTVFNYRPRLSPH